MFPIVQNSFYTPTTLKTGSSAKISIIGTPAVGKTTITKLLSTKQITEKYVPTQGFDLGSAIIDGTNFKIWDFGGQKAYIKIHLCQFIYGSDIIFVVTDSTPKNVLTTKELLDLTKGLVEDSCEIVAIANKQDLPGHLEADRIQNILQIPTYPMVAVNPNNYDNLTQLIDVMMHRVMEKKKL